MLNKYESIEDFITQFIKETPFYLQLMVSNKWIRHSNCGVARYYAKKKGLTVLTDLFELYDYLYKNFDIKGIYLKTRFGHDIQVEVLRQTFHSERGYYPEELIVLLLVYGYDNEQIQQYEKLRSSIKKEINLPVNCSNAYKNQMNIAKEMYSIHLSKKIVHFVETKPFIKSVKEYENSMTKEGIYRFENTGLTKALCDIYDAIIAINDWHDKVIVLDSINNTHDAESNDIIEGIKALNNGLYRLIIDSDRYMSANEVKKRTLQIKAFIVKMDKIEKIYTPLLIECED